MGKLYCINNLKGEIMNEQLKKEIVRLQSSGRGMDELADYVLKFMEVEHIYPVPIVKILKMLNFRVYGEEINDDNLSGYIAIDSNLQAKFRTDKIVCVNLKESVGHKRFTIAHEMAHYLFDYNEINSQSYYNTYKLNEAQNEEEVRASNFAACLLMPEHSFMDRYIDFKNRGGNLIVLLADYYKVSARAVELRIRELNLN